jgi:hypothetical protein
MIIMDGRTVKNLEEKDSFNAHLRIRLEILRKTRKKIAYSPETLNFSILECEDTPLH